MNVIIEISIFFTTLVGIYLIMYIADKIGLIDIPNERSIHETPVPRGAGIAFVLSIYLVLFFFNIEYLKNYYYIYIAIAIVLIVGALDDFINIAPKIKFIFIFVATIILYINHIAIYSLGTYFGYEIILPVWLVLPFTFIAISGYTNALNLMDGLDGLAASISIVILCTFLLIGIEYKDTLLISLSSFFVVSLCAFLLFNWEPAKIFMGDSGSLSLGIVISILAIQSIHYITPASILFIVAMPLLDTFIVITRRIQRHQSPFKADKNHMHHLLFNVKGDIRYTVLMLVMMQIIFSMIGYQVSQSNNLLSLILFLLLFYIYLNLFDQRLKRRKHK